MKNLLKVGAVVLVVTGIIVLSPILVNSAKSGISEITKLICKKHEESILDESREA